MIETLRSLGGDLAVRKAEEIDGGTSTHPTAGLLEAFGFRQSATGLRISAEGSMQISVVNASVRVRAESVATPPLIVYRRKGKAKDRDSSNRLYTLLHDRPNPWQTSFEWREMMQRHFDLRGNGVSYIERTGRGDVTAIYPLEHVTFHKSSGWPKEPFYQCHDLPGAPVLGKENIFHLRGMSRDGYVGISPIQELMESVGLAAAAEQWLAAMFANGGIQSGFLSWDGRIQDDKQAEQLRTSADKALGGGRKAWGRPGILDGKWSWVPMSMNAGDAQAALLRSFQVEDIARAYRMPLLMIGHGDKAPTYASAEQFFLSFVTHTMLPVWTRWEQALKRDLFTDLEGEVYPQFLIQGLLRGDIKTRYAAYAIARQWGWLNADEIREFEDMNPLPDGAGEMYLTPLNMIEAGTEPDPEADGPKPKSLIDHIEFARLMTRALAPALEQEAA